MTLHYQVATEGDIPEIFAQAKALIDTYEDLEIIDYDKVLAWMKRKITSQIQEYTAVSQNGEICAYYHLCEDGELDDVYVLPAYRNQGVGSQILQKCIDDSRSPLYLYVFSANVGAIRFYQRFGFTVSETVSNTRYIMSRNG